MPAHLASSCAQKAGRGLGKAAEQVPTQAAAEQSPCAGRCWIWGLWFRVDPTPQSCCWARASSRALLSTRGADVAPAAGSPTHPGASRQGKDGLVKQTLATYLANSGKVRCRPPVAATFASPSKTWAELAGAVTMLSTDLSPRMQRATPAAVPAPLPWSQRARQQASKPAPHTQGSQGTMRSPLS